MIKLLIALIAVILLTGCGMTKMTVQSDGSCEISTNTLWKDVAGGKILCGNLEAELGSSVGNGREEAIACLLAPHLCQ